MCVRRGIDVFVKSVYRNVGVEREILWRRLESLANLGIGEGRGPLFVFKYRPPVMDAARAEQRPPWLRAPSLNMRYMERFPSCT